MMHPRLLIAGIGNIFLGDDAFGSEVARRLARCALSPEVRVVDFGIRGLDLAYALLEDWQAVILIDATPRGGTPGTLYVIEPELEAADGHPAAAPAGVGQIDMHGMNPAKVLRLAADLGGQVRRVLLVGCEPASLADEMDIPLGMSQPVSAAVDEAARLVESLAGRLLADIRTPELEIPT